jgi:hypothetical protein
MYEVMLIFLCTGLQVKKSSYPYSPRREKTGGGAPLTFSHLLPKRVGIQIPPASYSPAPPSLLPTLPTNPLHLIPSVTWLGYLEGPVLWLALYLLIILPCLTLSPPCQNKKDNLIPFFICMTLIKLFNIYCISMHISMNHYVVFSLYLP